MNTPNVRRLFSAAAAACTTVVLLNGVVSISELQRSTVMAQQHQQHQHQHQHQQQAEPATEIRVAAVSTIAEVGRY
jgi:uncharacterized membrane protein